MTEIIFCLVEVFNYKHILQVMMCKHCYNNITYNI